MRAFLVALLALAFVLPGCLGDNPTGDGGGGGATASSVVEAPWWPVGSWWDIEITRGTQPTENVRLVNFWNDSVSNHFWLGVQNRVVAMDMALNDTNPLMGRIHWRILTPHESGIHALGMYTFPAEPGETFGGLAFGEDWEIEVKAGPRPGVLLFEGVSANRHTISYDYDSEVQWFTFLSVKDRSGESLLDVKVKDHGAGAKGAYYFLRGRDYYEGPKQQGTHAETFEVKKEDIPHKSLAFYIDGRVTGPLSMEVRDPDGALRHSEALALGNLKKLVEIPAPKVGSWEIRFTGTGDLDGKIEAVGILEYSKTL